MRITKLQEFKQELNFSAYLAEIFKFLSALDKAGSSSSSNIIRTESLSFGFCFLFCLTSFCAKPRKRARYFWSQKSRILKEDKMRCGSLNKSPYWEGPGLHYIIHVVYLNVWNVQGQASMSYFLFIKTTQNRKSPNSMDYTDQETGSWC